MSNLRYQNRFDTVVLAHKFIHLRDAVVALVGRDMKLRYKRSALGIVWTMLNPLAQLLVLGFVFRIILPTTTPNYTSFLFSGLLVWSWFTSSLISSTSSIVDNRDLIKVPDFPSGILPVVYVTSYLVHFVLAIPILVLMLFIEHVRLTSAVFALPLIILLQFVLTLSFCYLVATLHVSFRDTQYLLSVVLTLAFFVTPIFYDLSAVPEQYRSLYLLNPMVHLVGAYRDILLYGRMPEGSMLLILYLIAAALLGLGYFVFRTASYRFVEEM